MTASGTAYRTLGRTGLKVSPLALGGMTFGWGADKATARRLFDAYRDTGGNFIDTADLYAGGTSEEWLGEFIEASHSRDEIVLGTKFSFNAQKGNPNAGGNGRKNILRAVEGSLRRLRTDYIDLYLLHTWAAKPRRRKWYARRTTPCPPARTAKPARPAGRRGKPRG